MRTRELALVTLIFLAVSAVWTWPVLPGLGSELPFDPRFRDPATAPANAWAWQFWWVLEALSSGSSPFFCERISPPSGVSLGAMPFVSAILTLPLQLACGPALAVGVVCWVSPALAATATYLLLASPACIGVGRAAAGLASFAWAFSPFFSGVSLERLDLAASPIPPLFLLAWIRWSSSGPGRQRLAFAAACGLLAGLAWLSSAAASGWLALLVLVCVLVRPSSGACESSAPRSRSGISSPAAWAVAALALCVTTSPRWGLMESASANPAAGLAASAQSSAPGRGQRTEPAGAEDLKSAVRGPRLLDFASPSGRHPLAWRNQRARYGASLVERGDKLFLMPVRGALFLGIGFVTLALLGALLDRRGRRWAACGGLALFLVWNPGGRWSAWLATKITFFDTFDTSFWLPAATLPLTICVALGFEALSRHRGAALGRSYLALFVVLELLVVPAETFREQLPAAVADLCLEPERGSVAVLPLLDGAHHSMLWQIHHGRAVAFSPAAGGIRELVRTLSIRAPDLLALASGSGPVAAESLAFDLESLGIQHLLVCKSEIDDFAALESVLDSMVRWERGDASGDVAWWYRPSL